MDTIQKVLIKAGRKDLAQEYYKKFAGDPEWEGMNALWLFISMMHTMGIYESLDRLSDADLSKISKYDKEIATRLKKMQQIRKKEFQPLVEDLNIWFKENDKNVK